MHDETVAPANMVHVTNDARPIGPDGMSAVGTPVVELTGCCVHYDDVVALAPTSLTIRAGESVALVGANGSGKTTLLSLLARLVVPDEGSIESTGRVALVTQRRDQHRWMPLSVDEVLRIGRYQHRGLLGRMRPEDRRAVADAAERLEVDGLRTRAFHELSGGQQQRVLVAQALAARPDLLLLDEPITGLDFASQARILEVIDEHTAGGGTVVFSTHHLAEAHRATRVILLAGCVLADGPPEQVLVPTLLAEAFGGRLVSDDGVSVVVDDHGHRHDAGPTANELLPHHGTHDHRHEHQHDQEQPFDRRPVEGRPVRPRSTAR